MSATTEKPQLNQDLGTATPYGGSNGVDGGRKWSVADAPVSSVLPQGDVPLTDRQYDSDEEVLAALGYKAEFKREFSLWTTFSVSFAVLGLLPSFASTLYFGMGYAGTPGMTYGWLIAMFFIQCVAMSMAELCSSMPTSGGLYYAAAVLAPPGWGPLAAWLTGWSNWLAQVTAAPSIDYAMAAMILAAASANTQQADGSYEYEPENYQIWLLSTLIMLIHGVISSFPTRWLAEFNRVGTILNMAFLIIAIIIIPAATNRVEQGFSRFNDNHAVWNDVYPGTDFVPGVAILMSFVSVIWTMSGYDAPFHLAEECSNANVASPRAIVMTSAIGGVFGWFLQLVVAYTVVDIASVMDSEINQPYASYLFQILPKPSANAVLALTIVTAFFMGQGNMVTASRVTFAYARDGAMPLSNIVQRVNTLTHTPVNAVWYNCIIGILLNLLVFGGSVTISAMFSVGGIAAFVAFSIPIFIRVFFVGDRFRRGPWHLGRFSMPIGAAACAFVALMVPILCLPSATGDDLTPVLMNWTCLVYGAPMFFASLWFAIDARKWFKGPRVNIQHQMLGRGEVLHGKAQADQASSNGSDHGEKQPQGVGGSGQPAGIAAAKT